MSFLTVLYLLTLYPIEYLLVTHITLLEDDTDELARLIGGDSYSAYAIPHAKEMRAWADRYKASLK